jgi:hypothetical protein
MDCVKIGKLEESDFDGIITRAGGRRFSRDHSRETDKNADFVIGDAILELKLINEEGLEKEERQRKIAEIFRSSQPNRPVIILRPHLLNAGAQRSYYNAMMGPIKTHIEKANKQLKRSAEDFGGDPSRVLLLVNNGYAALSHEDFKEITVRRACNATHNIDAVVVAGLYYYSDTFDSYFFPEIDLFPIRIDRPFKSYDSLSREWRTFAMNFLTRCCILGEERRAEERLPVQELSFELDGVRFIKPAPPMGKPSEFFVNGRPRKNSTGITTCPPVACTFPNFGAETWQRMKDYLEGHGFFKDSYSDWLRFRQEQETALATPTRPFVPVDVEIDQWVDWCKAQNCSANFQSLCDYANTVFVSSLRKVIDGAKDREQSPIAVPRYVLLLSEVIGQDMANDLCSIYLVSDDLAGERRIPLVQNVRLFFEHGLALAGAFAVKLGVNAVRYEKDLANAWV